MVDELLDVEVANQMRQGRTVRWVIDQLPIGRTAGYVLFRRGILPEDQDKRTEVLKILSEILGVPVSKLVHSVRPKRKAS